MFIRIQRLKYREQEKQSLYLRARTEKKYARPFRNLTDRASSREYIILTNLSQVLQRLVSIMHLIQNRIYGLPQKILFQRFMITTLRTYLMTFMKQNIRINLKQQA